MNEERRLILEMLQNGTINVQEAEQLMEALKEPETYAQEETTLVPTLSTPTEGGISPKRLLIRVSANGKNKVNVKIPFSLVKVGLKLGKTFGTMSAKNSPELAEHMELLKNIDVDELLGSLSTGEITLPYTIVDVEDDEKGENVLIVLE